MKRLIVCVALATIFIAPQGAQASDGFFGVMSQTQVDGADLSLMKNGGVESVRIPFSWDSIEPEDDYFTWTRFDQVIGDSARAGITVLPMVYGSTHWVDSNYRRLPSEGDGLAEWNRMLTRLVERYGTGGTFWADNPSIPRLPVGTWQIWNEPNTSWFAAPVEPVRYAELLISSARTVRSIDPDADIMMAGLMASPQPVVGPSGAAYLGRLYEVPGFRGSFDSVGVQPYNVGLSRSMEDISDIRAVTVARGDRSKGIYVTEIGWGSNAGGLGMGSQKAQARQLTRTYRALIGARKRLNIKGVYWFVWQDVPAGPDACSFCSGNGLLGFDGTPKLAWKALKEVIRDKCVIPRLKGRSLNTARRMLEESNCGIKVIRVPRHSDPGRRAGTVLSQAPLPGIERRGGTKVRLRVTR